MLIIVNVTDTISDLANDLNCSLNCTKNKNLPQNFKTLLEWKGCGAFDRLTAADSSSHNTFLTAELHPSLCQMTFFLSFSFQKRKVWRAHFMQWLTGCVGFFLKLLLSLFVSRRACLKKCELTSPTCSICCVEKTKTCCFPVDSMTCTSSGPSLTLTFALLISVVFCCGEHCTGRRRSEKQVAYFLNRWTRRETHTFGCRFKKHGSAAKLLLK